MTFLMGQNKYSDLTNEEFRDLVGIKISQVPKIGKVISKSKQVTRVRVNNTNIKRRVKRQAPSAFDWRSSGKVSGAKDQG